MSNFLFLTRDIDWHISFYSYEKGEKLTGKILYFISCDIPSLGVIYIHNLIPTAWQNKGVWFGFVYSANEQFNCGERMFFCGCKRQTLLLHHFIRPGKDEHENLQEGSQWLQRCTSFSREPLYETHQQWCVKRHLWGQREGSIIKGLAIQTLEPEFRSLA